MIFEITTLQRWRADFVVAGVRDGDVRTAVEREVWVMVEQFCIVIAVVVATQIYSCGKVAHAHAHTHVNW